ncbi:HET-domain-containing protein [Stipitochalara longipes BDJ]|nr:HET-domain-containing protein [Stipitochalara longipes BDJ]
MNKLAAFLRRGKLRARKAQTVSFEHVQQQAAPTRDLPKHESGVIGVGLPTFAYDQLDRQSNHIRLVRILPLDPDSPVIQCELFHANLDDRPSFKALSYTWGSDSDPKHTISLNGCQFEVRDNLWHALSRFQAGNIAPVIWIDAICINQSSDGERNHQVARMKMIYEQATEVVVWLGESYNDSDLALQLVQELYEHRESTKWIVDRFAKPDIVKALEGLNDLFNRDYWWRIWIVQELTIARKIVFYCGQSSIDAGHLYAVQLLFGQMDAPYGFPRNLLLKIFQGHSGISASVQFNGIKAIYQWKQELASTNPSFFSTLQHHFHKESSDPRDMIYGLAALANQKSKYKVEVDYNLSTAALYTNFAKLEIETSKKLDILAQIVPGRSIHFLPSWVPDWSAAANLIAHVHLFGTHKAEIRYFSAGQTEAVTTFGIDNMTFKGVNIGHIKLLSPGTGMTECPDVFSGALVLFSLWKLFARIDRTSSTEQEAFFRTLTFNGMEAKHVGHRSTMEFLSALLGYLALILVNKGLIRADSNSKLFRYWEEYLVLEKKDHPHEYALEADRKILMQAWLDLILTHIWDRRFFISSSKAMGLGSTEIMEGDLICIPLGCCHPLILRKVENHYVNLGEAYVDGYMYGEAMEMLERGELKLEEFELH